MTPPPPPNVVNHGEYLLVTRTVVVPAGPRPELWLIRPEGDNSHRIAMGTPEGPISPVRYNISGVWSHDGRVVHVIKGCDSQLSDVRLISGATVPIVTMTNKTADFVWSPDDATVAYWRFTGVDFICEQNSIDDTRDLLWMHADGVGKGVLRHDTHGLKPTAWWPNGSSVLAVKDDIWYSITVPGGAISVLQIDTPLLKLSPDGSRYAFLDQGHVRVCAVDCVLTLDLGAGNDFAWSPNGVAIAVSGATLRIVNPNNAASYTLYAAAVTKPSWSPQSNRIAFLKAPGSVYVAHAVPGGTVWPVVGTSNASNVQWQP